ALSDRAQLVDARIRAFAGTSVAYLELAAAVLGAGWTVSATPWVGTVPQVLQVVVVVGGLVLTVVLLRRAAPRPPRRWSPEATPA
ncbi:hypothetical protein, partial [Cellulomonas bogoriensis]|uniref:hypothetical protein n=1 Tax=Cellulomonas bogoriensis TaxID=301388 RepID=UPI0005503EE0